LVGSSSGEAQALERVSPEAVSGREASAVAYEGLDAAAAELLAGEAFPALIGEVAGGPPQLAPGQSVVGYPDAYTATLDLGGGVGGALESSVPLAAQTGEGRFAPIDLGLTGVAGGFEPRTPAAGARAYIPKRLSDGPSLSSVGVSLVAVDEHGAALGGGEGVLDGATVFYGDTEAPQAGVANVDTLVKPSPFGFSEETLLRAQSSPQRLYFRVGMPEGASVLLGAAPGTAVVEDAGRVVARISASSARDAEGAPVPVSVGVSGDVLELSVSHASGEYRMPIVVDPSVEDAEVCSGVGGFKANWAFFTTNAKAFAELGYECESADIDGAGKFEIVGGKEVYVYGEYTRGQYAFLEYPTQKESRVHKFVAKVTGQTLPPLALEATASLRGALGEIEKEAIAPYKEANVVLSHAQTQTQTVCVEAGCAVPSVAGSPGNLAEFKVLATESGRGLEYQLTNWTNFGKELPTSVTIAQEKGPSVGLDSSDPTVGGRTNGAFGGNWISTVSQSSAVIALDAFDPGMGVYRITMKSPNKTGWGLANYRLTGQCAGIQCNECHENECALTKERGKPFEVGFGSTYELPSAGELPNGEDTVEAKVEDAAGLSATTSGKVMVDNAPPYNIELSGLPSSYELNGEVYHLVVKAHDGEGATPSSGVKSIAVGVDGQEIATQSLTGCSPGPCAASGEWVVNAEKIPAGANYLLVTVTDGAGNVAYKEVTLNVHHAQPLPLGPGAVDPQSGELKLGATDVSLGGGLTATRSYGSRHLTAGVQGPLGPQWAFGIGGQESLVKLSNGNMVLTDSSGSQAIFASDGKGGFSSPAGDTNVTLSEVENEGVKEFVLKDAANGTSVSFRAPSGGPAGTWLPSITKNVAVTDTTTYSYEAVEVEGAKVARPTEALAPVPAEVSCSPQLKRGCRALLFKYAQATSAKGENESEWGEYAGRLKEVLFVAYNPETKTMGEVAVAQYSYDAHGRLRAEWDPRVSPALKTTYGYDGEGHVTALTAPGQQTWALVYGTGLEDTNNGRLLKVWQATASSPLWGGESVKDTVAPVLSGSPAVGVRMAVSSGTWTGKPVLYGFQWERCRQHWECSPIPGATNPNYSPSNSDLGYTLFAQVTAINGDGAVTAASALSGIVGYEEGTVAPTFGKAFGSYGSGSSQFNEPEYVTTDASGNVWVADSFNHRIQEFTGEGSFVRQFGQQGSGLSQFADPAAVAIDHKKNVWVADAGNNRLEEFGPEGRFLTAVGSYGSGNGQFYGPDGLTIDAKGTMYVVDSGNRRIVELDPEGKYLKSVPAEGECGPSDVAIDASGNMWVAFGCPSSIEELSPEGSLLRTIHLQESGFDRVTVGPEGDIWATGYANDQVDVYSSTGTYLYDIGGYGHGEGQFWHPRGISIHGGSVYVLDSGEQYVNSGNSRVEVFALKARSNPTEAAAVSPQPGATVEYRVPVSGTGAPYALGSAEAKAWAQEYFPVEATAIFPTGEPQGWPATDYRRATVYYMDSKSHVVNVASATGGISTTQYYANGDMTSLSADDRALALKEGSKSAYVAGDYYKLAYYEGEGGTMNKSVGPEHVVKLSNGKEAPARSITHYYYNEGAPSEGGPYRLVTKLVQAAEVGIGQESDQRTTTMAYSGQSNVGWKLRRPTSVTDEPSGLNLTHTTQYEESTGNVTETRMPKTTEANSPHDTKTVYYTAKANSSYPACGEHSEWANIPCETLPGKQPETPGLPGLPVTTVTYNVWGEPLLITSTSGSSTRTTTNTYDGAGRPLTSSTTSATGIALATVSDKYEEHTGALVEQSTTSEGKTQSLKSVYNTLGQLTSYTDADGNLTSYEYEPEGDRRLIKVNDGKGTQTYGYDETSGYLTKLVDSQAGTFTASYDLEGKMTSETYPNGMTATYGYDPAGDTTSLVYKKETHCTEKCEWYKDTVVPTINGQWATQTSTFAKQNYTYDAAGRLTSVQEEPVGKGCMTRVYAYDKDTNRTGLTVYPPNAKGECSTEGGTTENHGYDEADRLTDTGAEYNAFGDTTGLPAADAGGSKLSSSFYVDNQLASETQGEQTIGYNLDPSGRTRETVSTGKITASEIQHYAGPGSMPSWTSEISGKWKRDILGIGGGLVAIDENGETLLQLPNLHGDIVATSYPSETATSLASTIKESTEYGVPATEAPPKYSWLGAHGVPTQLPSGADTMGARAYIPQLGRFLQTDPIPGGSANSYAYTNGNPANETDLTGMYTATVSLAVIETNNQEASEFVAHAIAAEEAARAEAERKAAAAAAYAAAYAGVHAEWAAENATNQASGYGEEEEWGEEEGEEYVAWHHPAGPEHATGNTEDGLLFQPLQEGSSEDQAIREKADLAALCRDELGNHAEPSQHKACVRYVFSLGDAWKWVKHTAKNFWHKGIKVARWFLNKQYERMNPGMRGPYSNAASTCEAASFISLVASPFIPESLPFQKAITTTASAISYANC
jgi:RHS repeat-associated protein